MYRCKDCGKIFENPKAVYEEHNLISPPFEKLYVCPECGSENIGERKIEYCRCCGSRLTGGKREYCNAKCRRRGNMLWEQERRRKRSFVKNPLSVFIASLEEYNRTHGTALSYGQYEALYRNA